MIGYPIEIESSPYTLTRAYYWLLMLFLVIFNNSIPDSTFIYYWPGLLAGWFFISYARIKDIGWNGWWCICTLIPLFNIIIGFIPSKTSHSPQSQPR